MGMGRIGADRVFVNWMEDTGKNSFFFLNHAIILVTVIKWHRLLCLR